MYIRKNSYLFFGLSGINRAISYSVLIVSYKNRIPIYMLIEDSLIAQICTIATIRPVFAQTSYIVKQTSKSSLTRLKKAFSAELLQIMVIFNCWWFMGNCSINRDSATGAKSSKYFVVDLSPIWRYILLAVLLGREEIINVYAHFQARRILT